MTEKITVTRARRMLGKLAIEKTNDQVQELIDTLYLLADENIMYTGSKESEMSNDSIVSKSKN